MLNLTRSEDIPDFLPGVTDEILFLVHADLLRLTQPWSFWIATVTAQCVMPLRVLDEVVILTAIGLIDGVQAFFFTRNPIAPFS